MVLPHQRCLPRDKTPLNTSKHLYTVVQRWRSPRRISQLEISVIVEKLFASLLAHSMGLASKQDCLKSQHEVLIPGLVVAGVGSGREKIDHWRDI